MNFGEPLGTVVLVVDVLVVDVDVDVEVDVDVDVDVDVGTVVLVVDVLVVDVDVVDVDVVVVAGAWHAVQPPFWCVVLADAMVTALPWHTTHFARAGVSPIVAWHWVQPREP